MQKPNRGGGAMASVETMEASRSKQDGGGINNDVAIVFGKASGGRKTRVTLLKVQGREKNEEK